MDEPFLDEWGYASGLPVRFYNGGKQAGASSDVPPVGDEGDVLTVVGGAPEWAPPAGGGGGAQGPAGGAESTYWLNQDYWLTKNSPYFAVREVPFWAGMAPSGAATYLKGYSLAAELDFDRLVIGTGTGSVVQVLLPATSDGQTFTDPAKLKAGFDVSGYFPNVITDEGSPDSSTAASPVFYRFRLSWTGGALPGGAVCQITDGTASPAAANRYYYVATGDSSTPVDVAVPSGMNTTSSNPEDVYFYCALGASRTWTLEVERASFVFA